MLLVEGSPGQIVVRSATVAEERAPRQAPLTRDQVAADVDRLSRAVEVARTHETLGLPL